MFDASQQPSGPARIVIIDGHPITRLALRRLLADQPDLCVCGEAANSSEALSLIGQMQPNLAIVELLPGDGGELQLIKAIRERFAVKILVYSVYDELVYAQRALRAGASGYLNKQHDLAEVIEAVQQVLAGRIYASPLITDRLVQLATGGTARLERSPVDRLSDRELQVFKLIGRGLTNTQIAGRLSLSPKTVAAYCEDLKSKLNLECAVELKYHAIRWASRNA